MQTFSDRLSYLIKSSNMKPAEFAKKVEISQATISRILGGIQAPNTETLYKCAMYFKVSMEYLLTGTQLPIQKSMDSSTEISNEIASDITHDIIDSFIVSNEEQNFLSLYWELSKQDRESLIDWIEYKVLKEKSKKINKIKSSLTEEENDSKLA